MPTEIKLPSLGDGIESGDVLDVLVQEGEQITKDQGIVEIETDKASVAVPSPVAGKVVKIHVASGQTVPIGALLMTVETDGGAARPSSSAAAEQIEAAEEPSKVAPGPQNNRAASPTSSEASQAAPAQPAPAKPAPPQPAAPSAQDAIGPPEPPFEQRLAARPQPARASEPRVAPAPARPDAGPLAAGPAIRRFAREVGVDLSTVEGTGEGGRITREDVLEVVRRANQAAQPRVPMPSSTGTVAGPAPTESGHPALPGIPAQDAWGPVSIEPASKIRKTIAARMTESWSTVPRVTNFDDADVTELEKIRQSSKEDYKARGIRLTSMPFVVKAVSMALRDHPVINASLDMEQGQIVYKQYVNVGVAVDTERGLVVPVLRNSDRKSIADIAKELAVTAERVRTNDFSIDDLRGGTFTISNLGAIGGRYSTPIVNVPEVAILLVGRARKMPVVVKDQIVVRLMMPLSLSYDHRLVDGAAAARFLNDVIDFLQAPGRLLLAP